MDNLSRYLVPLQRTEVCARESRLVVLVNYSTEYTLNFMWDQKELFGEELTVVRVGQRAGCRRGEILVPFNKARGELHAFGAESAEGDCDRA